MANTAALSAAEQERHVITQHDWLIAAKTARAQVTGLDVLDLFLSEATHSRCTPTYPLVVNVALRSNASIEGTLLWADPHWLKIDDGHMARVWNRSEIASIASVSALPPVPSVHFANTNDLAAG